MIEELDGSGNFVASFVFGPHTDEPLLMIAPVFRQGLTTFFYFTDGLGTITAAQSGTRLGGSASYLYDSYGKLLVTTRAGDGASANPFNFTGRERDGFFRARYYDPTVGRFLSEDPIRFVGGNNFYPYVGNNPVNRKDPFGLWRWPDFISGNFNVAIVNPWTGTWVGATVALNLDRNGNFYAGLGPNVGKTPTVISGSLTANWLNQSCTPTPKQLNNFLTQSSFSGNVGYWLGAQETYTPGSGTATGVGFVSPQAGVGYTYSWQVGNTGAGW